MASIIAAIGAGATTVAALAARYRFRKNPMNVPLLRKASALESFHKKGLIDAQLVHIGMTQARRHEELALDLTLLREDEQPKAKNESQKREKFSGGFEVDMTREEARHILGLTTPESLDLKVVQKRFRRLMLKNHPDIGGSAFLASKINEAKEILMGEKAPKGEAPMQKDRDKDPDDTSAEPGEDEPNWFGIKLGKTHDYHTYRAPKGVKLGEMEGEGNWRAVDWERRAER